jgi:hypothetical protein
MKYASVYSNILPQTQGGIFWNLEFEIQNKDDDGGRSRERAVDGGDCAKGDKRLLGSQR